MKKLLKVLCIMLVALWMLFIFYMSSRPATESNGMSERLTKTIVEIVNKVSDNQNNFDFNYLNHLVRKNAHFIEYLILGVLVMITLYVMDIKSYKAIVIAIIICVIYSISDELHQYFVPGRSMQLKDVLIDSLGSLVGIVFSNFVIKSMLNYQ